MSSSFTADGTSSDLVENSISYEDREAIRVLLNKKISGDFVSQRPGPGGAKLHYLQSWRSNQIANKIFGWEGWTSSIQSLTLDFVEQHCSRWTVCATAIVRVYARGGGYHEDVGCGIASNVPDQGQAIEKAKKEAVSDGRKRALRIFGDVLGNCLYDKKHLNSLAFNTTTAADIICEADLSRKRPHHMISHPKSLTNAASPPSPPPPNNRKAPPHG